MFLASLFLAVAACTPITYERIDVKDYELGIFTAPTSPDIIRGCMERLSYYDYAGSKYVLLGDDAYRLTCSKTDGPSIVILTNRKDRSEVRVIKNNVDGVMLCFNGESGIPRGFLKYAGVNFL